MLISSLEMKVMLSGMAYWDRVPKSYGYFLKVLERFTSREICMYQFEGCVRVSSAAAGVENYYIGKIYIYI